EAFRMISIAHPYPLYRRAKPAIRLSLLSILTIAAVFAQGLGTIVGTITDPSGASVPAARVTATEVLTNLARTVTTNAQGYYVIPSLRPSRYTILVDAAGFQKYEQQNVELLADQTLTVDAELKVGAATNTVTVVETPPQVDTTTGTLRQVVD